MKSLLKQVAFALAICVAFIAHGTRAEAASGFRELSAPSLDWRTVTLAANVSYVIRTKNLSAGTDTVLHVQNQDGTFLAGNDDFSGPGPNDTLASSVSIGAASYARTVSVLVRSYSSFSVGTATLEVTPSTGTAQTFAVTVDAGLRIALDPYAVNTRFTAVEIQGGIHDAAMLLIKGSAPYGAKFDDDNATDLMPFIQASEGCTSTCEVIIGGRPGEGTLPVRVYWDDSWMVADSDGDGIGNAFEQILGTNRFEADTDFDGLTDSTELYGYSGWISENLNRYPYYGANPAQKDVFLEVDWVTCGDSTSASCQDASGNYVPDIRRVTPSEAEAIAAQYAAIGISLHMDIGVAPPSAQTSTIYGKWSPTPTNPQYPQMLGAMAVPGLENGDDLCSYRNNYRLFMHNGVVPESGLSGLGYVGGLCFRAAGIHKFVHELGHNLTLRHGGDVEINFKPNYPSVMNYLEGSAFNSFSPGAAVNRTPTLNGAHVSEEVGLDGAASIVADLVQNRASFSVDSYGQVDWNRDGQIDNGTSVRAPLLWSSEGTGDAFRSTFRDTDVGPGGALGWLNGAPPRLYWFDRTAAGTPTYRSALRPSCAACEFEWPKDQYNQPVKYTVPTLTTSAHSLAAAGFDAAGSGQPHLVVFETTSSGLEFTVWNGSSWSAREYLGAADGPPAALYSNGALWVFAPLGGTVRVWTYTVSTNTWAGPLTQTLTSGGSLMSLTGVGVTNGVIRNGTSTTGALVTVVTRAATGAAIGRPYDVVALYRTAGGTWTELPALTVSVGLLAGRNIGAAAAPAIAYMPLTPGNENIGRFMVTAPSGSQGAKMAPQAYTTEGNDLAPSAGIGRFKILSNVQSRLGTIVQASSGSAALLRDPRYEVVARAAWAGFDNGFPSTSFAPFADGVLDLDLVDVDDGAQARRGACVSLRGAAYCP